MSLLWSMGRHLRAALPGAVARLWSRVRHVMNLRPPAPRSVHSVEPGPFEAPIVEGFFEARAQTGFAPQEAPAGKATAAAWLLPRDPHSFLASWQLPEGPSLKAGAPGVVLEVQDEGSVVKSIEVAPHVTSVDVGGLTPGHTYRAALWTKEPRGLLAETRHAVALPPAGPHFEKTVSRVSLPWEKPLRSFEPSRVTRKMEVAGPPKLPSASTQTGSPSRPL